MGQSWLPQMKILSFMQVNLGKYFELVFKTHGNTRSTLAPFWRWTVTWTSRAKVQIRCRRAAAHPWPSRQGVASLLWQVIHPEGPAQGEQMFFKSRWSWVRNREHPMPRNTPLTTELQGTTLLTPVLWCFQDINGDFDDCLNVAPLC